MKHAAPPGGLTLAAAKRAAEFLLWRRVTLQRGMEHISLSGATRPQPKPVAPTEILDNKAQWQTAVLEARKLKLPLHHDRPKNWDALGAVSTILHSVDHEKAAILDAGCARYSSVLPWLRLYGLSNLVGINIEFGKERRRGSVRFQYGDITATRFPTAGFDAITCMSVIEHGVPIEAFLAESARLLRPGGVLVVSTDYDQSPPNTDGKFAYGAPVHIFGPDEICELVSVAKRHGLDLCGELNLKHSERPVYWRRLDLSYTFIRLTFSRS